MVRNTGNRLRRDINRPSGRFVTNFKGSSGGTPAIAKSGGRGGVPQARFLDSSTRNPAGKKRIQPDDNRRRRKRQDVFRSAGMSMT